MKALFFFLLLAGVIAPLILINLRGRYKRADEGGDSAKGEFKGGRPDSQTALSPLTFLTGAGALILTVILVFFVAWTCYAIFRWPALARLRDIEQLVTLFANLAVTCYAFPAYTRTKNRSFLALAFASLIFAYGVLFSGALTSQATRAWRTTHSEAQWYYASRYVTDILGMILYAYAGVSLARSAKPSHDTTLRPNGSATLETPP